MTALTLASGERERALELVQFKHDEWRRLFEHEHQRLEALLDSLDEPVRVYRPEHVGSTAVDGLAATDIVDINSVADDTASTVSDAIATDLGGTRRKNTPT